MIAILKIGGCKLKAPHQIVIEIPIGGTTSKKIDSTISNNWMHYLKILLSSHSLCSLWVLTRRRENVPSLSPIFPPCSSACRFGVSSTKNRARCKRSAMIPVSQESHKEYDYFRPTGNNCSNQRLPEWRSVSSRWLVPSPSLSILQYFIET